MTRARRRHDIDDTCIAPFVLADCVVADVAERFGAEFGTREDADALGERARELYAKSVSFRRVFKRADPRPAVYAYMLHWQAARLAERSQKVAREVASAAWYHGKL